jgi:hypothetical protein
MACVDGPDLESRPIASKKSGDLAWVASKIAAPEKALFFLDTTSVLLADGAGVLTALGGVGRWLSLALYGTSPGVGAPVSILDIATLKTFDDSALDNGGIAFVQSLQWEWTRVVEADPLTADDITNVRNFDGTATWYRSTAPSRYWFQFGTYYINDGPVDPVFPNWGLGNDENDGLTALTPIASIAELNRRTSGMTDTDPTGGYFAAYVGPAGAGTGDLFLTCACDLIVAKAGTLLPEGTAWTEVASGTITNKVDLNRATNTPQSLTMDGAWLGWAPQRAYENTTQGGISFMRVLTAGPLTATALFTAGVVIGDQILGYTMPAIAVGRVLANGNAFGVEGASFSPDLVDNAQFTMIDAILGGGTFQSCGLLNFDGVEVVTTPFFAGAASPMFRNCVLRAPVSLGIGGGGFGFGATGLMLLTRDTAVLEEIRIAGGAGLQVGQGSLLPAEGSVYFATGGRIQLGVDDPSAVASTRAGTNGFVDFVTKVGAVPGAESYVYGSSVEVSRIFKINSTNCQATYVDNTSLIAVRDSGGAAPIFPWEFVDPPGANVAGVAAALPAGSAAVVRNPIGIFKRA